MSFAKILLVAGLVGLRSLTNFLACGSDLADRPDLPNLLVPFGDRNYGYGTTGNTTGNTAGDDYATGGDFPGSLFLWKYLIHPINRLVVFLFPQPFSPQTFSLQPFSLQPFSLFRPEVNPDQSRTTILNTTQFSLPTPGIPTPGIPPLDTNHRTKPDWTTFKNEPKLAVIMYGQARHYVKGHARILRSLNLISARYFHGRLQIRFFMHAWGRPTREVCQQISEKLEAKNSMMIGKKLLDAKNNTIFCAIDKKLDSQRWPPRGEEEAELRRVYSRTDWRYSRGSEGFGSGGTIRIGGIRVDPIDLSNMAVFTDKFLGQFESRHRAGLVFEADKSEEFDYALMTRYDMDELFSFDFRELDRDSDCSSGGRDSGRDSGGRDSRGKSLRSDGSRFEGGGRDSLLSLRGGYDRGHDGSCSQYLNFTEKMNRLRYDQVVLGFDHVGDHVSGPRNCCPGVTIHTKPGPHQKVIPGSVNDNLLFGRVSAVLEVSRSRNLWLLWKDFLYNTYADVQELHLTWLLYFQGVAIRSHTCFRKIYFATATEYNYVSELLKGAERCP